MATLPFQLFKLKTFELSLNPFSLFGTLVLKHLGIFLKNDSILRSDHKVPLHEIQEQSVKDLKTVPRNCINDFQPLTLEEVQKNIREKSCLPDPQRMLQPSSQWRTRGASQWEIQDTGP